LKGTLGGSGFWIAVLFSELTVRNQRRQCGDEEINKHARSNRTIDQRKSQEECERDRQDGEGNGLHSRLDVNRQNGHGEDAVGQMIVCLLGYFHRESVSRSSRAELLLVSGVGLFKTLIRSKHHASSLLMPTTCVKICCIGSIEEARLAVRYGASALGLVAAMPSGPGPIAEELIAEIAPTIPPAIGSFLLTSEQSVAKIIEQQRRCRVNTIQIVDRLTARTYDDLKAALPGVSLVQVIHVTGEESIDEACEAAERGANAILLDSGDQRLAIKLLGGTGRTHDWSISRRIRENISVPMFLAGGLNPTNVVEAIQAVRPFGVDVCSGLRTDGRLDETKLAAFMQAVRGTSI
jgi:phosphoribosylanthranilate isomerase